MSRFTQLLHDAGAYVTVQMVQQGGMPTGPSNTYSSYADHRIAHALSAREVQWLIREYGESAALALDADVDAIEIHANHDDVVQWFLSPLTNLRTDGYGGSFDNRRRFLREIVDAVRGASSRPFTFGLRLCLDEAIDGGYHLDECLRLVEAFTADGTVDYFSFDVGNNWGNPSYVQVGWRSFGPLRSYFIGGEAKQATHLPVVYTGRVTSAAVAEQIIAAGQADLVGMVRSTLADPDIARKELAVVPEAPRPCIGLNECINRKLVEGIGYACGVNPTWAREVELAGVPARTSAPRSILVIGGGPAGMELAALCAEQGHTVRLWEQKPNLGGLLSVAAKVRANTKYQHWIDWQGDRLRRLGVDVVLGRTATVDDVLAADADHVAVATGATPSNCPTSSPPARC
jgi:2,4-dienoyl-CoA reductase-like NADH-dependent reductase (Old Yellow Enzyme family)